MKYKLLIAFLFMFSGSAQSKDVCFIGDSIAHGYKISVDGVGLTKVGANPNKVLDFLKVHRKCDKYILSSGISNDPTKINVVRDQLEYLKGSDVLLLGTSTKFPRYGNSLNIKLREVCSRFSGCDFNGGFVPSKDLVHPKNYKALNVM